jgi:hypothetical protein
MNERIKELAEQASVPKEYSFVEGAAVWSIHPSLEQFAELIVRECAEVAGCNGHVSGFTLGDLIKEHFGVK